MPYLPKDIWDHIFAFDPTYLRYQWRLVIDEVPIYEDFDCLWTTGFPCNVRWECHGDNPAKGCWVYQDYLEG